ncbi:rab GTPase-binding effector protein 2 isoform X1 [Electrophorus electricus]|uniref:Rab GTPase-binding effector protein 2 n=1 Tax=Electrophorus electricus TaxID=8005 RepID=A0A4W4DVZ5_ELEEL|nr:rab GTPase-binding effector protein 2 isoform X1 [Electrophorus electricus]
MEVTDKTETLNEAGDSVVPPESEANSQTQLAECRAQLEHWKGVATICELSKQEELQELQRNYDQEIQSLQEAFRETVSQYEARISALQSERAQWRRAGVTPYNKDSIKKGRMETSPPTETPPVARPHPADPAAEGAEEDSKPLELMAEPCNPGCAGLHMEGFYTQHFDSASLSSFSMDTPSLPRRTPPQDDTASLVSTGTLVPEAIYLPPPGHRLVTHADWDALQAQVSELQGELDRMTKEKLDMEKELETQSTETQKQVSVLQSQVQTSETLLQELQRSFSQTQSAVQSRLTELSLSQKRVCSELCRLKGKEEENSPAGDKHPPLFALQEAHSEERLRIEIVTLKEQLEMRTEESEVLEVQLSSLKIETDRIQSEKDKLEGELQECRTELQGLRVALSHLQRDCKTQSQDKAVLQQQCLELRSQVISLRSQLDTSQAVQKDFVQLSQSLQVKLEQIRQSDSLHQVRQVLGEGLEVEAECPGSAS